MKMEAHYHIGWNHWAGLDNMADSYIHILLLGAHTEQGAKKGWSELPLHT